MVAAILDASTLGSQMSQLSGICSVTSSQDKDLYCIVHCMVQELRLIFRSLHGTYLQSCVEAVVREMLRAQYVVFCRHKIFSSHVN